MARFGSGIHCAVSRFWVVARTLIRKFRKTGITHDGTSFTPITVSVSYSRTPRMRKNDPVSHVMTKDVVILDLSDPISKARRLFEESGIHHLPVVKHWWAC